MLRALTLAVTLLLASNVATAAPMHLADLGGFGGPDTLEAVQAMVSGREPSHLLARTVCLNLDCTTLDGIDGRIAASAFDIVATPDGATGAWSFTGVTEMVNQSVSRTWYVQYVVIQTNFGTHVANQLFAPVETPYSGVVDVFAGGPVVWTKPHGYADHPTNHVSFYGAAVRAPEPTTLALTASAVAAYLLQRRRRR